MIESIANDRHLRDFLAHAANAKGGLHVSGLWGSSARMVASLAAERAGMPLLYITAHLDDADAAQDDLELFRGQPCQLLPAWEALPGEGAAQSEIAAERTRLCNLLRKQSDNRRTIVAPIQALMQAVPNPQALKASTLELATGDQRDPSLLAEWLTDHGFERLDRVEATGDFAWRGDILDIFPPGDSDPLRIEFFDERIESLRRFDVSTQRSIGHIDVVMVSAGSVSALTRRDQATSFLTYLPKATLIVLEEPAEIQEFGQTFRSRVGGSAAGVSPVLDVLAEVVQHNDIHLSRLGGGGTDPSRGEFHFAVNSLTRFEGQSQEILKNLCQAADTQDVIVFCDNPAEQQRLGEMVSEIAGRIPKRLTMQVGLLHAGFEWTPTGTICIGHHEIFHRYQERRRLRRIHATRPLESWLDLKPGDLVVHVMHGIARFAGMKSLAKGKAEDREEFLSLEFAGEAVLHVPVSQVDLVQKYIGAGQIQPRLSKLGSARWKNLTEQVSDAVSDLAESLLRTQAARESHEGIAYPADTIWQQEFESSFLYEDTEDQSIISAEVKRDLQRSRPMDRLLCGDVGYGKTELAIRAAFKVMEFGKQVAVLVPTTVLAEQHYRTFCERLADYPFSVASLSRFRSGKEQKQIIEDARKGRVDLLVGTHRILSKDVGFADLGLAIIDEEQRFGVEHKHRLRTLRQTVDVLTMTATPIPRTLHMSMLGLRDISSLATPPMDRRAIATQIRNFDPQLIREAILREMNREGQVYFIHNVVKTIHQMASELAQIVPEARVIVGHGQMKAGELQKIMTAFVRHEADILLATTIIESGIDIPRVNTIFINLADRFGLADLHQLRGRVGRSKYRGYCYLFLPRERKVTPKAARRLKSIEEFSELGAGFQIAMRDLEIRGAGNILGAEQSGHIVDVGYELYCQLLEKSVRRARGEPEEEALRVQLELGISGHIPAKYISAEHTRIDAYKRIVSARTLEAIRQAETDLVDAFGKFPKPVGRLLELAEIRILASAWGIQRITVQEPDIVFGVEDHRRLEPIFAEAIGTARMPDAHTVHWRPPRAYLEGGTLLAVLRKQLAKKQEVQLK